MPTDHRGWTLPRGPYRAVGRRDDHQGHKEDVVEQLRIFLPVSSNEARLMDQVDSHINKIIELGFLRRLRNDSSKLEVRRIIKAFIDAQWLHDFDLRLKEYAEYHGLLKEDA